MYSLHCPALHQQVAEAFRYGVPIVATSIALESIRFEKENEAHIRADSIQDFSDGIVRLLTDCSLWNEIAVNGPLVAERNFGFERQTNELLDTIKTLLSSTRSV